MRSRPSSARWAKEPSRPASAASVRLRRDYDAPIEDVWDALTNPERIGRWFLPISGDYRLGGRYQFEGNAGGRDRRLRAPEPAEGHLGVRPADRATDASDVEVRLSTVGDGATRLELEHIAVVPDEMWEEYGPGAVGVGWEQGLLGLSLHLRGGVGRTTRRPGSSPPRDATSTTPEQRGVGRGEPGRRRRSGDGRPRRREHDGVLRAGSGGGIVGERPRLA